MAQIKAFVDSLPAVYQPKDGLLTALAALTTSADQLIYATGADAFAQTALTAFMRTLLDDADAATACLTLGAIQVSALNLANPGYIKFKVGASSYFQVAWGIATVTQDALVYVGYPSAFTSFAIPNVSAISKVNVSANENTGYVSGSGTLSGFQIYNAENSTFSIPWIAVGA